MTGAPTSGQEWDSSKAKSPRRLCNRLTPFLRLLFLFIYFPVQTPMAGRKEVNNMNPPGPSFSASNSNRDVKIAKLRCTSVRDRIQCLPLSKITDSCKRTLLRLVNAEFNFLSHLSPNFSGTISFNIGNLESVVHILQQPFISGVSRVCKHISNSSTNGNKRDSRSKCVYVDIVCTLDRKPVWFIVSDRNPKYISWLGSQRNKGLKLRLEQVLEATHSAGTLKPDLILLFFSNGLDEVISTKLINEFGASEFDTMFSLPDDDIFVELEGEWVNVIAKGRHFVESTDCNTLRAFRGARVFQIKVVCVENMVLRVDHSIEDPVIGDTKFCENRCTLISDDAFCSLISAMRFGIMDGLAANPEAIRGENLINFDTTALVALVSGISNGGAKQLITANEEEIMEMRKRFKSNFEFMMAQVLSELKNPIVVELASVTSGKRGIICKSVCSEFKGLVSMCGGPNEKLRADWLLKSLLVVPDNPSARVMGLPTTRKIALKNKVVFGTGDYWRAPTLTANMGFVRAISQTGMSLLTLEHRPCALIGD